MRFLARIHSIGFNQPAEVAEASQSPTAVTPSGTESGTQSDVSPNLLTPRDPEHPDPGGTDASPQSSPAAATTGIIQQRSRQIERAGISFSVK